MRLPEDKSSSKTERSYAIEQDIGGEGEEEGYNHEGEEDPSDSTITDSVMAINGRSSSIKVFSKIQLAFDREFAKSKNP